MLVGGTAVEVGVLVGGTSVGVGVFVAVGGMGVLVGGTEVEVAVAVGGMLVGVDVGPPVLCEKMLMSRARNGPVYQSWLAKLKVTEVVPAAMGTK